MKKVIFFVALALIIGCYLQFVAATELKYIALSLAILAVITLAGGVFFAGWYLSERLKMHRAKRIEAEKEAHVKIVTAGNQVFIRETDGRAYWRAAHLDPRFYANGHYSDPTDLEVRSWQAFNAPKVITQQAGAMLPPTTQIDLLAALDSVQRCLIVGASDAGKTNLLQWLVSRRLATSQVIVIDPHSYPGKWQGCQVVGEGSNHAQIEDVLNWLIGKMVQRYKEIAQGLVREGEHPRLTVIIDEWMSIAYQCKNATDTIIRLLTESRKAAFSVFIGSHSERVKSLGLDGKGDLREGFVIVKLSIANGERSATIDNGNGPQPATMPGPFGGTMGRAWVIEGETLDFEPEPTEEEAKIIELHRAGESLNEIARQTFGSAGGHQVNKIKDVLAKFAAV